MARIDYAVSMTAIQSATLEGKTIEAIEADIGKTLSGGKSNTTWAGASNGYTHISSNGSTGTNIAVASGDNGLWIKHSGKKFDSGLSTTVEETSKVIVLAIGGSTEICRLSSGQAIFLPEPKNGNWKVKDDTGGEVVAVEVAVLS
tara:strand:- start:51 stop:485 length:435 start_codon:yes stop_codon:yes gene_type:complete